MAETPLIVQATADDVAYFARRRWRDEHGRELYVDLAHVAPNGVFVAKDEGTPIGIAIPHALEDEWFLSEIYVEPSFQKRGVGWQLLTEAAKEAGDVTRSGLLEVDELGGIAFFLRRGVSLQTPIAEVSGAIPHENELGRMAAGEYRFITEPLEPVGLSFAATRSWRVTRMSGRAEESVRLSRPRKRTWCSSWRFRLRRCGKPTARVGAPRSCPARTFVSCARRCGPV